MVSVFICIVVISSFVGCLAQTPRHRKKSPASALGRNLKRAVSHYESNDETPHSQTEGDEDSVGAKFFMDSYLIQSGPKQVEFGHVSENPFSWEQRYEKKDDDKKRFQGQARWGDKNGGYGEHIWDYNHGDNHGNENGGGVDESKVDQAYLPYQTTPTHMHPSIKYSSKVELPYRTVPKHELLPKYSSRIENLG